MCSRSNLRTAAITILVLGLLPAGCDTLNPGDDVGFQTTALVSNRLLFAGHSDVSGDAALKLRVINVLSSNQVYEMGAGGHDYSSPDIVDRSNGTFFIGFGRTKLKVLDTFFFKVKSVKGIGSQQRAINFNGQDQESFTYMDGSPAAGFDILVQNGIDASPVAITSDGSSSISNWTPCYSLDAQWILYAKIPAGATSGSGCELWRIHPDGTGAELLPITTDEVPTYATWNPEGTEVFVPGDFTSYLISDGTVGKFDHCRELESVSTKLAEWGYELVGSPVTGPIHEGDTVTPVRHTFPISAIWLPGDKLYLEALVAHNDGITPAPHAIAGVGIFTWSQKARELLKNLNPIPMSESNSENYSLSIMHPSIIP
ncbi:hypothetical protein ACFL3X_00170 [Gemmatimonadota bacterium]